MNDVPSQRRDAPALPDLSCSTVSSAHPLGELSPQSVQQVDSGPLPQEEPGVSQSEKNRVPAFGKTTRAMTAASPDGDARLIDTSCWVAPWVQSLSILLVVCIFLLATQVPLSWLMRVLSMLAWLAVRAASAILGTVVL